MVWSTVRSYASTDCASGSPSRSRIGPRRAGIVTVRSRSLPAATAYVDASSPCNWMSRPARSESSTQISTSDTFSRRRGLASRTVRGGRFGRFTFGAGRATGWGAAPDRLAPRDLDAAGRAAPDGLARGDLEVVTRAEPERLACGDPDTAGRLGLDAAGRRDLDSAAVGFFARVLPDPPGRSRPVPAAVACLAEVVAVTRVLGVEPPRLRRLTSSRSSPVIRVRPGRPGGRPEPRWAPFRASGRARPARRARSGGQRRRREPRGGRAAAPSPARARSARTTLAAAMC